MFLDDADTVNVISGSISKLLTTGERNIILSFNLGSQLYGMLVGINIEWEIVAFFVQRLHLVDKWLTESRVTVIVTLLVVIKVTVRRTTQLHDLCM